MMVRHKFLFERARSPPRVIDWSADDAVGELFATPLLGPWSPPASDASRRIKDITYGKNTADYRLYASVCPPQRRVTWADTAKAVRVLGIEPMTAEFLRLNGPHPMTPDRSSPVSKRRWDGLVRTWKGNLHAWAAAWKRANESAK